MAKIILRFFAVIAFCVLLFFIGLSFLERDDPYLAGGIGNEKMKGVCWVAGDSITDHNIKDLADVGANWLSQTPFGSMRDYQRPEVIMHIDRVGWGESTRGLKQTALLARSQGIKTMLKPHIWLRNRDGKWRSDIAMTNEKDWKAWFQNYGELILHYARIAEESNMEALCIGTELHQTTKDHPEKWRKLIKEIREIYSGQLTYAANWYKEYEDITFWDDLDFIGIQAYFPLSNQKSPSKKILTSSWERHKKDIYRVAKRYNKKVVFTEIGYKNTDDAAIEPWSWPQHLDADNVTISEQAQVKCYQALFESVWDEPWMDGIFIWKWFNSSYRHDDIGLYFEERSQRWNKRRKERGQDAVERQQIYFTPQLTRAKEELRRWYSNN